MLFSRNPAFLHKLQHGFPLKACGNDVSGQALFIRKRRKSLGLTQVECALRAGVGLRFLRELEQGKETVRLDAVNKVLALFGHETGPVPQEREL